MLRFFLDNFRYPWRYLDQSKEKYTLMWESKHLMRLGNAFAYILNSLMSVAATEALKFTVLAGDSPISFSLTYFI